LLTATFGSALPSRRVPAQACGGSLRICALVHQPSISQYFIAPVLEFKKIYYIVIKIQNTTFAVVYFTLVAAASDTSSIVLDL
jgi:hypothetical protein